MPIRRFDHRARFRAKYLNDIIDQVNLLNKARFYLYGQGSSGGISMGGTVGYSAVYELSDTNKYCPPMVHTYVQGAVYNHFWLNRSAIPTWGHTINDTYNAYQKALSVSANAAAGAYDQLLEDTGWGGYDLTGVTAGSYLASGGYSPPTSVDIFPCPDYYPGTSPIFLGTEESGRQGWDSKAGSGGVASVFPEDPGGIPGGGGGNFITIAHNSASFRINGQGAGFYHLLQSLPPGAVVVNAKIPVKLSSFLQWTQTSTENPVMLPGAPIYDGTKWLSSWDPQSNSVYESNDSGSVSFMVMGRKKTGTFTNSEGRIRRQSTWEVLGTTASISVSTDAWVILDVASLCNSYLNTWRNNKVHFDFALFPSIGPAPLSDAKGWLAGLPPRPAFEIAENPLWDYGAGYPDAKNHGYANFASGGINPGGGNNPQLPYQDYGPFNRERIDTGINWGGLEQGEGVIEWTYPASEAGHRVTYTNIVRGDNPIVV